MLVLVCVGCGLCWLWFVLVVVCVGCGLCWLWFVLVVVCVGCSLCWFWFVLVVVCVGSALYWLWFVLVVVCVGCGLCWLWFVLVVVCVGCGLCCFLAVFGCSFFLSSFSCCSHCVCLNCEFVGVLFVCLFVCLFVFCFFVCFFVCLFGVGHGERALELFQTLMFLSILYHVDSALPIVLYLPFVFIISLCVLCCDAMSPAVGLRLKIADV